MHDLETLAAKIKSEVTYSILVRPENDGPEGHFASGDDNEDAETCRKIREDAESNEWAWCVVEVRAEWNDLTGSDFLGGCSYASEKDFKEGGYFEDMQDRAFDELVAKVAKGSGVGMNPATLPEMREWILRPRLSARFYERLGLPIPETKVAQ